WGESLPLPAGWCRSAGCHGAAGPGLPACQKPGALGRLPPATQVLSAPALVRAKEGQPASLPGVSAFPARLPDSVSSAPSGTPPEGRQKATNHRALVSRSVVFGDEIEVLKRLYAGDTVVVHPGDDIPEGTVVEAVPLPE